MQNKLIITNGDSAVASIAHVIMNACYLPWRDILHDGPVQGGLSLREFSSSRAKYISSLGWGTYEDIFLDFEKRNIQLNSYLDFEEVILWFEHDLYDQLQLIQILDWFAKQLQFPSKFTMICHDHFISETLADKLDQDFELRKTVQKNHLLLGKKAWTAFCSESGNDMNRLLIEDTTDLPFLQEAFARFLMEFPGLEAGISKTQLMTLQIIEDGFEKPTRIFKEYLNRESVNWCGDWSFWTYLEQLINCQTPLIRPCNFKKYIPPLMDEKLFLEQKLELSKLGEQVLAGKATFLDHNTINHWKGGIHITNDRHWCWDDSKGRLVEFSV